MNLTTPTVSIDAIEADDNIRSEITLTDQEHLFDLTQSVKEQGVLEPVLVTNGSAPGKFKLIAGFRRHLAAQMAGLTEMPITFKENVNHGRVRCIQLVENLQRMEMNPMEVAFALKEILDLGEVNQQELADQLGVSGSYVSQHLSFLELPSDVQKLLKSGKITFTHARHLCRLPSEELIEEIVPAILEGATASQTDDKVKKILKREEKEAIKAEKKAAKAKGDVLDDAAPPSIVDQYEKARLKVQSEDALRSLLVDYAERYVSARSDEKKNQYRWILEGLEMAAGMKT